MLDQDALKTKILQIEDALQTQELILKLLREGLWELKEQSVYHAFLDELRQVKRALGDSHMEYPDEFELMRNSINETSWPPAIDEGVIVDGEPQKEHRAENIVQFVITDYLKDLKFLDFGCGEGHVVFAASRQGTTKSIGFDLTDQGWDRFEQKENQFCTTKWDDVLANGPYDVILMFDVLDHAEQEDPISILGKAKSALSKEGKLYIKCHPWSSRHGNHLYELGINKAFAHLIFDEIEITRIFGKSGKHTLPITHPLHTYRDWFNEAEWEIDSEYVSTSKVEKFFLKKEIIDRIAKYYPQEEDVFDKYISIDFVDYVLRPKEQQIF